MDAKTLRELLSRVKSATGRDRKIDAAIWEMAGIDEAHCLSWCSMDGRTDITRDMYVSAWAPRYTTSVDDCVALAGRVLPGWGYILRSNDADLGFHAHIALAGMAKMFGAWNTRAGLSLALLGATFAALISQCEAAEEADVP